MGQAARNIEDGNAIEFYMEMCADPVDVAEFNRRQKAHVLREAGYMTMREFIAVHAGHLLDDFDDDAGAYERCDVWLRAKENELGIEPTIRPDGRTPVYHPALLDHCLHTLASYGAL